MFDPYHKWLGILQKDQPPNHYRLLSVELFESDLDVIEGAADRLMGFVRQYQSGEHAEVAAKILNEIATARLCLLKPQSKSAYDAKLREQLTEQKSQPDFDVDFDSDLQPVKPRRRSKQAPAASQGLLIGGGIGAGVCLLLLVLFLNSGRKPPEKPDVPLREVASANSISTKSLEIPAKEVATPPKELATPKQLATPKAELEQPITVEESGPPVDLIQAVDLQRDKFVGDWRKEGTSLICGPGGAYYLPAAVPDHYQLRFNLKRIAGSDGFGIGFMMSGQNSAVSFDAYGLRFTGLYVDGREPSDNCTTRLGTLLQHDRLATVFLTVHPDHFHAAVDGKTVLDWHGESERLFCHAEHHPPIREIPFFAAGPGTSYRIETATLIPIKPEAIQQRLAQLDHEIDLLPLIDLTRDIRRGNFQLTDGLRSNTNDLGKVEIPVDFPEEYTVTGTIELPPQQVDQRHMAIGLRAGGSLFQCIVTPTLVGLDMLDGKRAHENETTFELPPLKMGVPIRIACTVTKEGIRTEVDGKTVIDWRGDRNRLSIPGDWSIADGRHLYLGSVHGTAIFRDFKLGPPISPPVTPFNPSAVIGKSTDLLSLIDPQRDSLIGSWTKERDQLRVLGDALVSKLVVPCNVPSEYKLSMRVARENGGQINNDALVLKLPTIASTAQIVLDSHESTLCSINNGLDRRVKSVIRQQPKDVVVFVRQTGVQILVQNQPILEWTGNVNVLNSQKLWASPAGRIVLGSWGGRFRFEKLEIEPIEASSFPDVTPLGRDGNVLSVIDIKRDVRQGPWELTGNGLICPAVSSAHIRIPVPVPDRYELTANVERRTGGAELQIGLVVGGRPCAAGIDALGINAGLMCLDGRFVHDPRNITFRQYPSLLLPIGEAVKVRCKVLPDTVIVICGNKEVIRWHGDPRRFKYTQAYQPPNYSREDGEHLWLGSWQSEFLIRDLVLRPIDDVEAKRIESEFDGVFPTTSQANVPLKEVAATDSPAQVNNTLTIQSAMYGFEGNFTDITRSLSAAVHDGQLLLVVDDTLVADKSDSNNAAPSVKGKPKSLHLKYQLNGTERTEIFEQNRVVQLDARPPSTSKFPKGFRIVDARQGTGVFNESTWTDVAKILRPLIKKDALSLTENDLTKSFGAKLIDSRTGVSNSLFIRYQFDGQERTTIIPAGTPAFLGDVPLMPGLVMLAFDGANFERQVFAKIDAQVAVDYGHESPGPDVPNDNFSVRWLGTLDVPKLANYSFYLNNDDGARLWIDGELVIDAWTTFDGSGEARLTKKQHQIRVEMYDGFSISHIKLEWKSDSIPREIIPASVLFHDPKVAKQLGVK